MTHFWMELAIVFFLYINFSAKHVGIYGDTTANSVQKWVMCYAIYSSLGDHAELWIN